MKLSGPVQLSKSLKVPFLAERRLAEEPKTLETLSIQYGVSRERVRQIEVRAYGKLQATIL